MSRPNDVVNRSDVLAAYQAWIINREHEVPGGWLLLKKRLEEVSPAKSMDWAYECFNCGAKAVYWMSDASYADCGIEGDGVVHFCTCENCGADIEYYCPEESDEVSQPESKDT